MVHLSNRPLGVVIGLFAALALVLALPAPASAQQTTGVTVCPVPSSAIPDNGSLAVCVDRGPNSTYFQGETVRICVTANNPQIAIFPPPPPPTIRLTSIVNGITRSVLFEERFTVGERCVNATISPPFGAETILAEAISEDGRVFLTDSVSFQSVIGPQSPPTPVPPVVTPAAPVNLRTTALDPNRIRLDWEDRSVIENGFRIYNGANLITTVPANTTTYTVTGLAAGSYYCFQVTAFDVNFESPGTGFACGTTPNPPAPAPPPPPPAPPAAPTGLTATALNDDEIRLTWTDNAQIEDSFSVYNGFTLVAEVSANSTTYIAQGFAPSSYNCFRVQALNDGAGSGLTDWACATTFTDVAAPTAPSGLTATVMDGNTVMLAWTDNAASETSYLVYNGNTLVATLSPNDTDFVATGLTAGFYNCFRVQAVNEGGPSDPTSWACASAP